MLSAQEVCGICHHLLLTPKSGTLIICKAIDINPFVSSLLHRNPDLIYESTSRVLKNRTNSSKIRFITGLNLADRLIGLKFESVFHVSDIDPTALEKIKPNVKHLTCFAPIEE